MAKKDVENQGEQENGQKNNQQGELFSLDAMALEFRLPSWQQAALAQLMGWEKGKVVSHEEYSAALASYKNRPLGGGR